MQLAQKTAWLPAEVSRIKRGLWWTEHCCWELTGSWSDTGIFIKVPKGCSLPDEQRWLWGQLKYLLEVLQDTFAVWPCCREQLHLTQQHHLHQVITEFHLKPQSCSPGVLRGSIAVKDQHLVNFALQLEYVSFCASMNFPGTLLILIFDWMWKCQLPQLITGAKLGDNKCRKAS